VKVSTCLAAAASRREEENRREAAAAKRRTICRSRCYRPLVFVLPFSFLLVAGCADTKSPTTQPMTVSQQQDAALNDPFGYHGGDMPTVTGGKTGEFDKQGFKRDMDRVFNP
jgi:hypothetical protein